MTHKTDEEIVEEFRSVSQKKVGEGYIGDLPYTDYEYHFTEEQTDWLRTTLKAVREESYQKGYNAGLADGTDKPLLAIGQIREDERERIYSALTSLKQKTMPNDYESEDFWIDWDDVYKTLTQ